MGCALVAGPSQVRALAYLPGLNLDHREGQRERVLAECPNCRPEGKKASAVWPAFFHNLGEGSFPLELNEKELSPSQIGAAPISEAPI